MNRDRGIRLRERILTAESKREVESLLRRGDTTEFQHASSSTRSRWKLAAERRLKQLAETKP